MIVVDLDGTLLNINNECSVRTRRYLKSLKDLGYVVVIATGRVLRSAVSVTGGAEFANYVIANAGAVVYDMDNSKLIMGKSINLDDVRRICSYYNDEIKNINICDLFYHHKYMNSSDVNYKFEKRISNIDRFLDEVDGVYSISVHTDDNSLIDKYYEMVSGKGLDILVMQDSFSDIKCLEIFSEGVSKYNAIKVIMEKENISNKDVIAFGDGLNDVDMIKLSGIGVAMGNALDEVKNVSNYITISHNDDGVIYFLKEYFGENNLIC